MVAETYSGFAQRYNMIIGILLNGLSTSILFLILPTSILFLADIFLVVGSVIGLYFTFKYRKESQSHIGTGIVVGFIGSVLSLSLICFFVWILYYTPVFGLFSIYSLRDIWGAFAYNGVFYIPVGIVVGYLFGRYFRKRKAAQTESPLF